MVTSYLERRARIEAYFDRTAAQTWARLTSDAPVSRIRATVRAGRDAMRSELLAALPSNLAGCRVLDAGCGTGQLACAAARRGARVVAVDLSPTLINIARERMPQSLGSGSVTFVAADMLDPVLGEFDYTVGMDSLIHYDAKDMVDALATLAARTARKMAFTFVPRTVPLAVMHRIGRFFPRSDRAPSIEPVAEDALRSQIAGDLRLASWTPGASRRISNGFYISQSLELVRQ
jgi:magnesium-protoporphyrin O-methyltransferase